MLSVKNIHGSVLLICIATALYINGNTRLEDRIWDVVGRSGAIDAQNMAHRQE